MLTHSPAFLSLPPFLSLSVNRAEALLSSPLYFAPLRSSPFCSRKRKEKGTFYVDESCRKQVPSTLYSWAQGKRGMETEQGGPFARPYIFTHFQGWDERIGERGRQFWRGHATRRPGTHAPDTPMTPFFLLFVVTTGP